MGLEQLEQVLREGLDALGPAPRAELLHVRMLPDFERIERIGAYGGNPGIRVGARRGRVLAATGAILSE